MPIAVLCAARGIPQAALADARAAIAAAGGRIAHEDAFDGDHAIDLHLEGLDQPAARAALEAATAPHATDALVLPPGPRRRALLVADMDSTMIGQECIDELADYAGVKAEVAAITERAMRGELDFADALRARVATLRGLGEDTIARCLVERVTLTPGALALVRTMRAHGARALLVSGGFTGFVGPVAARLGFDGFHANTLAARDGVLTGTVLPPIIDSEAKRAVLLAEAERPDWTLAVGDGANDAPMLRAAGFGVAYRAKPAAVAAAHAQVRFGDLGAVLWAQGWPRAEWVR